MFVPTYQHTMLAEDQIETTIFHGSQIIGDLKSKQIVK